MLHSIIIPCRDRDANLTVASIRRSAGLCSQSRYEIIVATEQADDGWLFNKPRLLNWGIERAQGDVLTFLDVDMLVGAKFMATQQYLIEHPDITRLCYRVRQLRMNERFTGPENVRAVHVSHDFGSMYTPDILSGRPLLGGGYLRVDRLEEWFGRYGSFTRAFEAYGAPDAGSPPYPGTAVFGNSQFSIRRDVLGDIRFDERFEGAGFEDMDMVATIAERYGRKYQAVIATQPHCALLHIWHGTPKFTPDSPWCNTEANARNKRMYYQKRRMARKPARSTLVDGHPPMAPPATASAPVPSKLVPV